MKINTFLRSSILLTALLLPLSNLVQAQNSLEVSSATVAPGGSTTLNLSLSSVPSSPLSALQWVIGYPATSVGSFTVAAGPALSSAGKSLTCTGGVSSYTCIAWGMNSNAISDGVVATISVTLSGSTAVPVTISSGLGASSAGDVIAASGIGGTVSVSSATTITSVACSPGILAPNDSSTCTVILGGSRGGTIGLSSNSTNVTVPASLTIPAGSGSGTFLANAKAFAADQTATVTATLNGSSKPATLSLALAQVTLSALQCATASLTSNANTTCTVNLSSSPTSSTVVTLSNSASSALDVPSSVSIAANATSATFTASTGALVSDQTATLTATVNGSSKLATLSLVALLTLSGTSASAITSSGATITWTTNKASDSQLAYGATPAYGSVSILDSAPVTSHKIGLTGLTPSTIYHYKVVSHDAQGTIAESGDFTLTTSATTGPQILLQLHSDASEVSGVTNDSIVTPTIAPSGFTGKVVVTPGGSVNFAPAQAGNGVYFLKCCNNSTNAYYKFTGSSVGSVFNVNQGQISFYLKSRQSFAQRLASATSYRQAFDVQDANTELFQFNTQAVYGYLRFGYTLAGASNYYIPTPGTEEALFGNGIILKVTMSWDGSVAKLFLNDNLVQQSPYSTPTPNWSAASNFDFGAYEYLTFGGLGSSDDIIDEFTVTGSPSPAQATLPTISSLQCTAASLTSHASTTCTVNLSNSTTGSTMVTLSDSASPALNVPSSVSIAANATSATFTASTGALVSDQTATLTATVNGSSKLATLSLVAPLTLSGTSASAITSSGATITWTTNKASDSQLAYGATPAYGSVSILDSAPVTSHKIGLTGLTPSTIYHYKVVSHDAQGTIAESGDFTLTTSATTGPQILLQLHSDASEVSGVTNGSIVTPTIAPPGFTGKVVVTPGGSVNFAPAQAGNGVYFLKCCNNSTNAYYKFTGSSVGSVFNVNQGQISFYLKSRQSFAQRLASATSYRQAFDVQDANTELFQFNTQAVYGYLRFGYTLAGASNYYIPTPGTEEALFGNGIILKVTMSWDGSVAKLFLNDNLVQQSPYSTPTPNWSAASNFDFGAYEYLTFGGLGSSDDIIDEFTVTGSPSPAQATLPTISSLQCTAASLTSHASTTCTVNLSNSTTSSTMVTLSDSASPALNVPSSVSIAANATSATFTASTGALVSDQTATLTATVNGSSKLATLSLVAPLTLSGTSASAITSSGATITWTTNKASDSQLAYGATPAYGSVSILDSAPVTSHKIGLTGLTPSTIYHYKVVSHDAQGTIAESGDFTLTTSATTGPQILLQLHSDASEVSGVTNGSIVTPTIAPPGFTGKVVVTPGGSVNFAPAQAGNGVYFLKCCNNSTNAYYKFTGSSVGSVFNVNQGQISFYLKSRQSFAQRLASATSYRQAFDVQDANTELFQFNTQAVYGYLRFGYTLAGASNYYIPTPGTEEALFGNGIILKVTMSWDGSVAKLFLNDNLVQQSPYSTPTPNWSAASNFDFGAYEYLTFGGLGSSDDIIDEFTVTGPARSQAPLMSSTLMTPRTETDASIRPVITSLQNGANETAPSVCSPEAAATLMGHFLPEDAVPASDRSGRATSLAGARVLINGSYSPVLYVSADRIDFLCPAVPPSTSLEIAVETAAGLSNRVETRVEEASPGIFAPVVLAAGPGGTVSIRATGMTWLAKFPVVRPYVRIGTQYVPIESITPDPQDSGVSTLIIKLPSDISGDSVTMVIEVVQTDGRSVASNPVAIPVETRQRAESQAPIGE